MSDHDDHTRLRGPLLRRIIIVAVILAAVPVMMWSFTGFVRGYVAQPKTPTFRPIAPMTLIEAPNRGSAPTATDTEKLAEAGQRIVEARATVTDARPSPIIPIQTPSADTSSDTDNSVPASGSQIASATPAQPTTGSIPTATPAISATPAATAATVWPAPPSFGPSDASSATQSPAPDDATVDALPPAAPIKGRIPLPPHRPRLFAMAQPPGGVPVPRARPAAAPEPAPVEPEAPAVDRMLIH